jgi:hypothetical protein
MGMKGKSSIGFLLLLITSPIMTAGSQSLFEDFDSLENWKPLTFPKIEAHSRYTLEKEGDTDFLRAESEASASGLIFRKSFDVRDTPVLRWRWRVDGTVEGGDGESKSGDDYALRIYVIFEYDPDSAGGLKKLRYNLARGLYGEYPPDSALNYIWANRKRENPVLPNAYSDRAMMIAVDGGDEFTGRWREYSVNILEDYRRIFGSDPPPTASLALMSDSDITGKSGGGDIDYIILSP